MSDFSDNDYWKGIILYGLNSATYKMALGKVLLDSVKEEKNVISWNELSEAYLKLYQDRLANNAMPQQGNPTRLTKMERIVQDILLGNLDHSQAVGKVSAEAFSDVIPRFQTIGTDRAIVKNHFYEIDYGNKLTLKDSLLNLGENDFTGLEEEIHARWALLEGAFSISHDQQQYQLANDVREIYLKDGTDRKSLTDNVPFLQGYQGNICFYCGEAMSQDIHVDHVLPRQVLHHDEIWNLVLSHSECNLQKSDYLVGEHFIQKLIMRNENIMGSNHPWKNKISEQLGNTPRNRSNALAQHYENVKAVLGNNYWRGIQSYNPATDPFYRKLITAINNR